MSGNLLKKLLVFCFVVTSMTTQVPFAPVSAATASNVYNTTNLGYGQSIIARTAQGIVNKSAPAVPPLFIDTNLWNYQQTASTWLNYYTGTKGYTFTRKNTLDDLLKAYKNNISGLAVYDYSTDASRWIAETYSGIHNTLPVSSDMVDVAFQDNFSTINGWNTGGDGGQTLSSDGDYMRLTTGSSGTYAMAYRNITVDLSKHKYIQLDVKGLTAGASWYMTAYYNGSTYWIPSWSTSHGFYICDLTQTTGWSGTKTIQISVGVQGGSNKTVTIDWFRIGKYGFADNFWAVTGWQSGSPSGGHSVTCDGEKVTLNTGTSSGYSLMYRDMTVNLDDYSYASIKVTAATGTWHVAVYDGTATYRMYPSGTTGEFIWQIGANTNGKRGQQSFQVQIVCDGGTNKSVSVDWFRIGRHSSEEGNFINSFTIHKDFRTMNWTDDTTAYNWAIQNLLPLTDKKSAYCIGDEEYASDSGKYQASSLDIAIKNNAFCFRLPPAMNDSQKAVLLNTILSNLTAPAAVYGGWSNVFSINGEETFITNLSQKGHYAILSCGSNGSFHAAVPVGTVSFNQTRSISAAGSVDTGKYYIAFMAAEGDTFASADDFVTGNWCDPNRGQVAINWGWNPHFQTEFPGMAEYYRNTATSNDYFFSDIPVGYCFLTEMPNKAAYGAFSKSCLDAANIGVVGKWDRNWDLSANKNYATDANASAIFEGIMPGAVDSADGNAYAQVRTLENGVPFVTTTMTLMYPTKNADGTPLTAAGLADLIRTEAQKHKKPFFLKVTPWTYKNGTEFDYNLPTKLKQVADLLGTNDYKVVKLDEFVGALKKSISFQDDFVYKSILWEYGGPNGGVTLSVNSEKATLNSGGSSYGLMYQTATVDLSMHKYVQINVPAVSSGASWFVSIYDKYGSGQTYYMPSGGTTQTGTFTYDITSVTGWTGTKKFEIQVGVQGGTNKSIQIDWLRIGSVTN